MNTFLRMMMLVGMMGAVSSVYAEDTTAQAPALKGQGIEKRIDNQEKRIDHKLAKKKISADQAAKMKQDVEAVRAKEVAMKKEGHGKLTKAQRKELHAKLKTTSQEIKGSGEATAPSASSSN